MSERREQLVNRLVLGPVDLRDGPILHGLRFDFGLLHDVELGVFRVTASFGERAQSFRAVLEKHGDALVMVALGPHGGRAFVLAQRGDDVTFESQMPSELPFPPEYMLFDVHRAWLVAIAGAPLEDGEHRTEIDGEELIEVWQAGRLQTRSFRQLAGVPTGLFTITYEGGLDPSLDSSPPARVVIDNGWFGYRLVLDQLSRGRLPAETGDAR